MAYPSTILSLAHAIGSQFLSLFFGGSVSHATGENLMIDDLIAVETKLGTGASTASANTVLRGTGSGTTAFGKIVNGDITAGTITDAAINGSAAIAVSKLAAGANKTLFTSDGSTNSMSASPTVSGTFTAETALKSGGGVYPSGGASVFGSAPLSSQTKSATQTWLIGSNTRFGRVWVIDHTAGLCATFSVHGGFNTVALHTGDNTKFGTSIANDNKIHIAASGGNYVLYNGYAVDHVLSAWFEGI